MLMMTAFCFLHRRENDFSFFSPSLPHSKSRYISPVYKSKYFRQNNLTEIPDLLHTISLSPYTHIHNTHSIPLSL